MPPLFDTVLVANRGEIAGRVFRTLRRLGIRSVAVHSVADADAPFVGLADIAVALPGATPAAGYLAIDAIVDAARVTGAQAIHPGYGFLAENADFARACAAAGVVFIGPSVHALEVMGDKIRAKKSVAARGVPVVPGLAEPGLTDDDLAAAITRIGYPALIKPSAGGGGKGMHVVDRADEIGPALAGARREALASFGDDTLFVERLVRNPRHIEVQILADNHGHTVHLGERECSLQRRHQKVIEESPSPLLDAATRARIGEAACETARSVDYRGAGTVEFIVPADRPDEFCFMEMNTRLQVEHPVTELVTGVDLVEWQLRIAAGQPLTLTQDQVVMTGHAIEARVYAEDPARGFLPTGGTVLLAREPDGVRVDSAIVDGTTITSDYDPMMAKVIAWAPTRDESISRLHAALTGTVILGLRTNLEFLTTLLDQPDVRSGDLDTGLIGRMPPFAPSPAGPADLAVAAMILLARDAARTPGVWQVRDGWRLGAAAPRRIRLRPGPDDDIVTLSVTGTPERARVGVSGVDLGSAGTDQVFHASAAVGTGNSAVVRIGTVRRTVSFAVHAGRIWWTVGPRTFVADIIDRAPRSVDATAGSPELRSPMPGSVTALLVADGSTVAVGDPVLVIEAMKMEHTLRAAVPGVVGLLVGVGAQVAGDQVVARLRPIEDEGAS